MLLMLRLCSLNVLLQQFTLVALNPVLLKPCGALHLYRLLFLPGLEQRVYQHPGIRAEQGSWGKTETQRNMLSQ